MKQIGAAVRQRFSPISEDAKIHISEEDPEVLIIISHPNTNGRRTRGKCSLDQLENILQQVGC